MKEIALHIMDIAENSIAAGAQSVEIIVKEDLPGNQLCITVEDNGRGMDEHTLAHIADPFVTGRTTRVAGLGIPFLKAAAEACNGDLRIVSSPGGGTRLEVEFDRNHIDRMPLGDLSGTVLTLVVGFPETDWIFRYQANGEEFTFDAGLIKRELTGIPLTEPSILRFIRELLENGVRRVQRVATT